MNQATPLYAALVLTLAAGVYAESSGSAADAPDECADGVGPSVQTQLFLLIMGIFVFFMQAGFSLVEAGSVGESTVTNILFKNVLDIILSAICWWSFGYWFAFGAKGDSQTSIDAGVDIGIDGFFMQNTMPPCLYAQWFFQWSFAATTVTITSGAMAGRTSLFAYSSYAVFMVSLIYPLVVHWTWSSDAWLTNKGYSDFAGSGIVHCTGGAAALIGAIIVGPRYKSEAEKETFKLELQPHSMPMVVLGTIILVFGFFAFNGGSVLTMDSQDDVQAMALAMINTVMAAAGGGLASLSMNRLVEGHFQLIFTCNGLLAGMVAICGGAASFAPWAAFVIGIIAGCVYFAWSYMLKKLNIDDAIDAIPVHLGAGIWGVIAVPLLSKDDSIFYHNSKTAYDTLGWNVAGVCLIIAFTMATVGTLFKILDLFGKLRIDDEIIQSGIDKHEHNENAYSRNAKSAEAAEAMGEFAAPSTMLTPV